MIAKTSQCRLTALTAAVLLALSSAPAAALSLGRVTVQSALGEPLHAEVDFLDINAEEAASLKARLASPDAFKAAGLEYNAALSGLKTTLQRRANGRAYLKLSSDRVVNEPFVDLILEASWSSGRIVRDYTLLFDPPNLRSAGTAAPDKAQLPIQSAPAGAQPAARSADTPPPVKPAQPKPVAVAKPKPAAQSQPAGGATVRVKPGETAGKIAAAYKPANVSLDQMLVAMLRGNPKAFIQDNVNRIKAGAILTVPTPEQAAAVDAEEATQTVVAQSRDFNEFRRRLADNVPQTQTAPAGREASGKVQATVQDKTPAAATPDKLTLSKGSVQGKSGEDKLAAARNAEDAKARAAEVAKNLTDLDKLAAAASAPAPAPAPTSESSATSTTALPTLPTLPQATSAPVAASAPPATATVSAPAPAASKPVAKLPEPLPEPSFIDTLVDNPMLPGGVIALLGLLAGLAYLKTRQRKQDTLLDSTFAESSLAEAFSGASGGQSVDTSDSLTTGSSMVYSPSQLDAADDVDPVAEADVYLAYGRDLQAEEILKDALRSTPQRVAIHVKLAEIYAKRRDLKAFEAIAALAFNLTDGTGPEWEQICEKGLSIDPDNALYLPGGQPGASAVGTATTTPEAETADEAQASAPAAPAGARTTLSDGSELDLDLDFSLEEPEFLKTPAGQPTIGAALADEPLPSIDTPPAAPEAKPEPVEPTTMPGSLDFTEPQALEESQPAQLAPELEDNAADFIADLSASAPEPTSAAEPEPEPEPVSAAPDVPELPLTDDAPAATPALSEEPAAELSLAAAGEPMAPAAGKDMLSFDLDSLSLDLAEDRLTMPGDLAEPAMDALETKLALAEEFRAIGDDDGARALIEEVIAEASGDVKAKAQQALNKL